jgi:hypothetical protein
MSMLTIPAAASRLCIFIIDLTNSEFTLSRLLI